MLRTTALPLRFYTMGGLGDCIYARPFVRAWSAVRSLYVETPWPQLYMDMDVRFTAPWRMRLRTQEKNMHRASAATWSPLPRRWESRRQRYALRSPRQHIVEEITRVVGWPDGHPFVFDLPDFGPSPVPGRVAVVRPVTVRREWANHARNPDPVYVAAATDALCAAGYTVVGLADIDRRQEPAVGELPRFDVEYLHGELPVEQALALVQHASVVVGGIGWIVPASIAAGTPAIFIGGGQGGHNRPSVLTDHRMDTSRIRFILPDDYCATCCGMKHDCPKHISDFDDRFAAALEEVSACAS